MKLPIKPVGYRMLVKQVIQENKTESGLILATDEEHERQQRGFPIYEVLAQGDACYKARDGQEFPEGKWCEVGDIILMDGYAGKKVSPDEFIALNSDDEEMKAELKDMKRLKLNFHLVNDDSVMGVLKK